MLALCLIKWSTLNPNPVFLTDRNFQAQGLLRIVREKKLIPSIASEELRNTQQKFLKKIVRISAMK